MSPVEPDAYPVPTGGDVNAVIRLVIKLVPDNGDAQLLLLAAALVLGAKSCKVEEGIVLQRVRELFAQDFQILPLDDPRTMSS